MIKIIILDNDPEDRETLSSLLEKHFPGVEVIAVCASAAAAVKAIQEQQPQLLFLDIGVPEMEGFQLLDKIRPINFELILISERDQNAINAIHYGAVDYLLKPIKIVDLQKAVERAIQHLETKLGHAPNGIWHNSNNTNAVKKVALPTMDGLQMILVGSIIYCTSDSNYTNFVLKNNRKLTICRTLKEVERILEGDPFLRVHNSCIVNLNRVEKYIKGEGGSLVMSNGTTINVSRSRKEMLLKKLQPGKV